MAPAGAHSSPAASTSRAALAIAAELVSRWTLPPRSGPRYLVWMPARAIWILSLFLVIGCKGGGAPEGSAAAPRAEARQNVGMQVVRISKGSFPAEKYEQVRARLDAAKETLVPAIEAL